MFALVASLIYPREKVLALLNAAFKDHSPVWHIAEHIEKITFGTGLPVSEERWRSGAVFCEKWEIRWRQWREETLTTILTEENTLPPLPEGMSPQCTDRDWRLGSEVNVQLRGRYYMYPHVSGFMEVRIPHFLDYPAPSSGEWKKGDEAIVVAVPYKKNGAVQFLRFKELKAVR